MIEMIEIQAQQSTQHDHSTLEARFTEFYETTYSIRPSVAKTIGPMINNTNDEYSVNSGSVKSKKRSKLIYCIEYGFVLYHK